MSWEQCRGVNAEHQVGRMGAQRSSRAKTQPPPPAAGWPLPPASLHIECGQCPQNPLTAGNGGDQACEPEGTNQQLTQKAFETDPAAAGLLGLPAPRCDAEQPRTVTEEQGRALSPSLRELFCSQVHEFRVTGDKSRNLMTWVVGDPWRAVCALAVRGPSAPWAGAAQRVMPGGAVL